MAKDKTSGSRILFFSELFSPAQNSTAYYLTGICRAAATKFDRVHVFCATAAGEPDPEEAPAPQNLTVHRLDSGRGNKNKIVSRVWKFCRISLKFTWAIFRHARSTDTVFAVTNPAFMIPIIAAFFIRRK